MLKQPRPAPHETTRTESTSLFGQTKLVLGETPKAISPFGGLASFIAFLGQIGFAPEVQRHLPFAEPTSHNAIPLAHCLTAFLMSVVVGAQRFAHCQWLRADHVLHALLGVERFPGDDTIRNFFLRFSQAHIEAFWRPRWRWLLRLLACPKAGFSLDLDSTVFCREGKQEGARKGFNPRRRGRKSHHPLLEVPGYTFRVWVTNRSESAVALWRDYNGRACVEQRIEELKHDLAADGFCLQPFFATEAAFLAVLFTFNLLSLYQHQTPAAAAYRQPGTLRVAVFLCGAVLGKMGREVVLKLSAAWGGLGKHKPLVEAALDGLNVASPKLVPLLDRLAIGGGHI
jgi:hypothetical protein